MKANEALEKVWVNKDHAVYFQPPKSGEYIEYVRKDAFIEKAEEWLRNNQRGFILTDKDITDFVNYMKGE